MTDQKIDWPPDEPHGKQGIPYEWGVAKIEGERYIVRDVPEGSAELYRVVGSSRNLRVLAQAEAVVFRGKVLTPEYEPDYKAIAFYHDYGGRMESYPIDGWLRKPVSELERVHVAHHLLDFPEKEFNGNP